MLAEFCAQNGIPADVSSATAYGASLLPEGIGVLSGRMHPNEICILLCNGCYAAVIDATHPYAENITHTLRAVCDECRTPYVRLLREQEPIYGESVANLNEIVALLNTNDAVILSTLGSKSVHALCAVRNFQQRIWLRILPSADAALACRKFGFQHVIEAKGPFSVADNMMHLRQSGAEILLTKESGRIGGYPEKCEAAKNMNVRVLTLRRPADSGLSYEAVAAMLLRMKEGAE